MTRRIMVTHNGTEYSGEVMTITSTALGTEDHGLFVAAVTLEGNGTGVTFGDYALDGKPDPATHERTSTAYGLDYIRKIMWVVGVDRWERLKGMRVVTLYPQGPIHWGQRIVGLANLVDEDRVFIPAEHAAEWKDEVA